MEFSPANNVVKLCIQGMAMEDQSQIDEARKLYLQAWNEATDDFEKYLAAYYIARVQENTSEELKWLESSVEFALKVNSVAATSALPNLYSRIAETYSNLGDTDNAERYQASSDSSDGESSDDGPFFHGTRADLDVGDLLTPGGNSNYKSDLIMNHIYFTALPNGAGLAASLAKGDGRERVYVVEPTGSFENDPNVTDKKFPGNPTRSYRSDAPLKIVGELTDWAKQTPEQLEEWRAKLAKSKGEIIN